MKTHHINTQTRKAKWGWGILISVSALLVLNGASWFFLGPSISISGIAENFEVTLTEFKESFPQAARTIQLTARLVSVWFMAFGILAALVATEGYRHGSKWAWYASWVLFTALIAIGIIESGSSFGAALFVLAALAFVGQLLTRRDLTE